MKINELLDAEENSRKEFKNTIMSIVLSICTSGDSHVPRGKLHQYIYTKLGFHGKPGKHFSIFISKLLQEQGYRKGFYRGYKIYHGLKSNQLKPYTLSFIKSRQKIKETTETSPKQK